MPDGHQHAHDEGRGHVRHTQTPLVPRENRGPETCPGPQRELPTLPRLLRSEPRQRSRQKRKPTSSWLPPLDRRENNQRPARVPKTRCSQCGTPRIANGFSCGVALCPSPGVLTNRSCFPTVASCARWAKPSTGWRQKFRSQNTTWRRCGPRRIVTQAAERGGPMAARVPRERLLSGLTRLRLNSVWLRLAF
jgi:hypothetical protein